MSANRFAQAGPIMQGIAAWNEGTVFGEKTPADRLEILRQTVPYDFGPSNAELVAMIQNVADQVSEVAAQLVEVRQRLDALERPKPIIGTVGQQAASGMADYQRWLNGASAQQNTPSLMQQLFGSKLG